MSKEKEILKKLHIIRDELRGPSNTYAQQELTEVIELLESEPEAREPVPKNQE